MVSLDPFLSEKANPIPLKFWLMISYFSGRVQRKLYDCHEGQELCGNRNWLTSINSAHDHWQQLPKSLQGQQSMLNGCLRPRYWLPDFVSARNHLIYSMTNKLWFMLLATNWWSLRPLPTNCTKEEQWLHQLLPTLFQRVSMKRGKWTTFWFVKTSR